MVAAALAKWQSLTSCTRTSRSHCIVKRRVGISAASTFLRGLYSMSRSAHSSRHEEGGDLMNPKRVSFCSIALISIASAVGAQRTVPPVKPTPPKLMTGLLHLNPQPEPPGVTSDAKAKPLPHTIRALNPQPEPPGTTDASKPTVPGVHVPKKP